MCKQCVPGASPFFTRAGDEASQTVALFPGPAEEEENELTQARLNYTCMCGAYSGSPQLYLYPKVLKVDYVTSRPLRWRCAILVRKSM